MKLLILGNGAGGPFQGRHYTAQVLRVENHLFLIDCGEGTQMQLHRYHVRFGRFRQIFISHLHGDHVFGLAGLLTSFCLQQRTEPLQVFSPPGLSELVHHTFRMSGVVCPYPIEFVEVDADAHQKVFENASLEVWTIPLHHRVPCSGWLFREKPRPRKLRKEAIDLYNLPIRQLAAIKGGADFKLPDGSFVPNELLTLPPKPPASYAFCSDTAPSAAVMEAVKGVDLLYHEATFLAPDVEHAGFTGHSTARDAAVVAREAGVSQLLLGHFSARYKDTGVFLQEAKMVFDNTLAAEEGMVYEI